MRVHLIGNCQIHSLHEILRLVLPGSCVTSAPPVHSISQEQVLSLHSQINEHDIILTQPIASGYREDIGIDTQAIARLLDNTKTKLFLFPNVHFEGFHPTWGYMRLEDGALLRGGNIIQHENQNFRIIEESDYHDFLLLCCLSHGLTIEQTCNVLRANSNVEAVREWFLDSLKTLSSREAICMTSVYSLLPKYMQIVSHPCPMHSYNHPNVTILTAMALQISAQLVSGDSGDPEHVLRSAIRLVKELNIRDCLDRIKLPVYNWVSCSISGIDDPNVIGSTPCAIDSIEILRINGHAMTLPEFVSNYFEYYSIIGVDRLAHNLRSPKGLLSLSIMNEVSQSF